MSSTFASVLVIIFSAMCSCCVLCGGNDNFNKLLKLRTNIAQCRASCLQNFADASSNHPIKLNYNNDANNMGCTSKTNWKCNMCWDYCENLTEFEKTRIQMCSDDICLEGCKHACKFHNIHTAATATASAQPTLDTLVLSSSPSPPLCVGLKLAEPKVTKSGIVISWSTTVSNEEAKLLYVAFGMLQSHTWEEIQQTAERQLTLHKDAPKYAEIAVVAFDQLGHRMQQDNKKLVFNSTRTKRSVVDFDSAGFSYAIPIAAAAILALVAFIAILIAFSLRKLLTAKQTNDSVPIVWV